MFTTLEKYLDAFLYTPYHARLMSSSEVLI
jgi:hypothetical protein